MDVNKSQPNEKETESIIEKYSNLYSKEDFYYLIGLLPYQGLVIPLKSKEFQKDIEGFSYNKLPVFKLRNIYYTKIVNKKHQILAVHLEGLVNKYLANIDEQITDNILNAQDVRKKIENDDDDIFEKLLMLLIELGFNGNPTLYFKMVKFNLLDKQMAYIETEFKNLVRFHDIKIDLQKKYEHKIKIIQKSREEEIKESDKRLKHLEKEKINLVSKYKNSFLKLDQEVKKNNELVEKLKSELLIEKGKTDMLKHKNINLLTELSNMKAIFKQLDSANESNKNLVTVVENLERDLDTTKEGLKQALAELDLEYSKFSEKANEKWTKSNNERTKDYDNLKKQIEELKIEKIECESANNLLNKEKMEIENSIIEIQKSKSELIEIINSNTENIGSTQGQEKIFRVVSKEVQSEADMIYKKIDFISDLSENLEITGISNEFAHDLAQYIYGVFTNKMALLLIGYKSRKIADAISHVICARTAEIIIPQLGYNDINELISLVSYSNSKVILIENAVDSLSENIYIPLIKQNQDKFLIFSMESTDSFTLIPKSILNYMAMVDIDTVLDFEKDGEFLCSFTDEKVFDHEKNITSIKSNLYHIESITGKIKLNKVMGMKLAEIMSIVDRIDRSNALADILVFELLFMFRDARKLEIFKDIILEQGFNSHIEKELLSLIREELVDE